MKTKTFILTQFGKPHAWTQKYINAVQFLGKYGWNWKIITPNDFKSQGNVEIIPMKIHEFNWLVEKTCGVNPGVEVENGIPSKPMSDYYVASGLIFSHWLKDTDFWGITNWDVVYGYLPHFITDKALNACDIWTDEVCSINGVFSLFRNTEEINNLFKKIPSWKQAFQSPDILGTDEYGMSTIAPSVRFCHPKYYPLLGHDRLENHRITIKPDGSLWELNKDMNPPRWIYASPYIGREIMYYHFKETKVWPSIV